MKRRLSNYEEIKGLLVQHGVLQNQKELLQIQKLRLLQAI